MEDPLDVIVGRYARKGHIAYDGEGVTQLQHGWQCAQLARRAGASDALVLACWLHDIGHLVSDLAGTPTLQGIDDRHEALGARVLREVFGDAVARPVGLHVMAKRYRVAVEPDYARRLSDDSRRSLALQGGPLSPAACEAFIEDRHAADALRLRAWDDMAKRAHEGPGDEAAALAELRALMQRVRAAG